MPTKETYFTCYYRISKKDFEELKKTELIKKTENKYEFRNKKNNITVLAEKSRRNPDEKEFKDAELTDVFIYFLSSENDYYYIEACRKFVLFSKYDTENIWKGCRGSIEYSFFENPDDNIGRLYNRFFEKAELLSKESGGYVFFDSEKELENDQKNRFSFFQKQRTFFCCYYKIEKNTFAKIEKSRDVTILKSNGKNKYRIGIEKKYEILAKRSTTVPKNQNNYTDAIIEDIFAYEITEDPYFYYFEICLECFLQSPKAEWFGYRKESVFYSFSKNPNTIIGLYSNSFFKNAIQIQEKNSFDLFFWDIIEVEKQQANRFNDFIDDYTVVFSCFYEMPKDIFEEYKKEGILKEKQNNEYQFEQDDLLFEVLTKASITRPNDYAKNTDAYYKNTSLYIVETNENNYIIDACRMFYLARSKNEREQCIESIRFSFLNYARKEFPHNDFFEKAKLLCSNKEDLLFENSLNLLKNKREERCKEAISYIKKDKQGKTPRKEELQESKKERQTQKKKKSKKTSFYFSCYFEIEEKIFNEYNNFDKGEDELYKFREDKKGFSIKSKDFLSGINTGDEQIVATYAGETLVCKVQSNGTKLYIQVFWKFETEEKRDLYKESILYSFFDRSEITKTFPHYEFFERAELFSKKDIGDKFFTSIPKASERKETFENIEKETNTSNEIHVSSIFKSNKSDLDNFKKNKADYADDSLIEYKEEFKHEYKISLEKNNGESVTNIIEFKLNYIETVINILEINNESCYYEVRRGFRYSLPKSKRVTVEDKIKTLIIDHQDELFKTATSFSYNDETKYRFYDSIIESNNSRKDNYNSIILNTIDFNRCYLIKGLEESNPPEVENNSDIINDGFESEFVDDFGKKTSICFIPDKMSICFITDKENATPTKIQTQYNSYLLEVKIQYKVLSSPNLGTKVLSFCNNPSHITINKHFPSNTLFPEDKILKKYDKAEIFMLYVTKDEKRNQDDKDSNANINAQLQNMIQIKKKEDTEICRFITEHPFLFNTLGGFTSDKKNISLTNLNLLSEERFDNNKPNSEENEKGISDEKKEFLLLTKSENNKRFYPEFIQIISSKRRLSKIYFIESNDLKISLESITENKKIFEDILTRSTIFFSCYYEISKKDFKKIKKDNELKKENKFKRKSYKKYSFTSKENKKITRGISDDYSENTNTYIYVQKKDSDNYYIEAIREYKLVSTAGKWKECKNSIKNDFIQKDRSKTSQQNDLFKEATLLSNNDENIRFFNTLSEAETDTEERFAKLKEKQQKVEDNNKESAIQTDMVEKSAKSKESQQQDDNNKKPSPPKDYENILNNCFYIDDSINNKMSNEDNLSYIRCNLMSDDSKIEDLYQSLFYIDTVIYWKKSWHYIAVCNDFYIDDKDIEKESISVMLDKDEDYNVVINKLEHILKIMFPDKESKILGCTGSNNIHNSYDYYYEKIDDPLKIDNDSNNTLYLFVGENNHNIDFIPSKRNVINTEVHFGTKLTYVSSLVKDDKIFAQFIDAAGVLEFIKAIYKEIEKHQIINDDLINNLCSLLSITEPQKNSINVLLEVKKKLKTIERNLSTYSSGTIPEKKVYSSFLKENYCEGLLSDSIDKIDHLIRKEEEKTAEEKKKNEEKANGRITTTLSVLSLFAIPSAYLALIEVLNKTYSVMEDNYLWMVLSSIFSFIMLVIVFGLTSMGFVGLIKTLFSSKGKKNRNTSKKSEQNQSLDNKKQRKKNKNDSDKYLTHAFFFGGISITLIVIILCLVLHYLGVSYPKFMNKIVDYLYPWFIKLF